MQCGYLVKQSNHEHHNNHDHFIADLNVHAQKSNVDLQFHSYDNQVRDGSYPLHIALSNKATEGVIRILVDERLGGNDVLKMKDKFGKTPLDIARDCNCYDENLLRILNPNNEG